MLVRGCYGKTYNSVFITLGLLLHALFIRVWVLYECRHLCQSPHTSQSQPHRSFTYTERQPPQHKVRAEYAEFVSWPQLHARHRRLPYARAVALHQVGIL